MIRWVWHNTSGAHARIVVVCLIGLVRIAAGLSFVWVSKMLVDAATAGGDVDTGYLVRTSILLASLLLTEAALSLTATYLSNQAEVKLKIRLSARLYDHLLQSRWDKMEGIHSGDLLSRLTEDVRVLVDAVCHKLPDLINMLVQCAAAFALLFFLSSKLALCIIVIMPFFLLLSKIYVKKTRRITAEVRRSDATIQTSLQEGLQHHVVVQTLECEPQLHKRLADGQRALYGHTMHRTVFGVFSRAMVRLGFIGCYLTAFLWSVWHLHTGTITYGTMTAFLQLVARIQNPLVNMSHLIPSFVQALTSIDRLREIEGQQEEERGDTHMLKAPAGIKVNGVSFAYPGKEHNVFTDFSHDFKPGTRTVIMGMTGVGKSTLVRMLLSLLHPQKGSIDMYDTKDTYPVSPATRCNIAYVPQGNSLLEGTIRDNLLLGNPSATEQEIASALHVAVAEFVYDLPQGLDTKCGELGAGLSEGQAQRIAIARALLRKGSVLLFDEFNSSLDEQTASTLMNRLIAARPDATFIFISHRPEVASDCTDVLRLQH